jgi:prepilin-type processing-associated H-X9-DG protein
MRDDLIGFVLGALDADELEEFGRKVEQDPGLKQQVKLVEGCLRPLAGLRGEVNPPDGLARRTCECVRVCTGQAGRRELLEQAEHPVGIPATSDARVTLPVQRATWGSERCDGSVDARHWTTADFVVAAGVCLAMACLFFPALINSRYNMQLASCQDNMRQLGQALHDYSLGAAGYFPTIPPDGNLSFAGVFVPKLNSKGLVPDPRVFLCAAKGSTYVLRIPPLQDIAAAQGVQLVRLHHEMGGDYAYNVGYLLKGRLHGIRNDGRSNMAILSDVPLQILRNSVVTTHARGQNVLFADGHVSLVGSRVRPHSQGDDLFANDLGHVRAGLHPEDAVLGASHVSPLPAVDDEARGPVVTR